MGPGQRRRHRSSSTVTATRRLDANGKPIFNQIIEFRDRAAADKLNALVLGLIRAEHRAALSHPDGRGV